MLRNSLFSYIETFIIFLDKIEIGTNATVYTNNILNMISFVKIWRQTCYKNGIKVRIYELL